MPLVAAAIVAAVLTIGAALALTIGPALVSGLTL